MKIKLTKSNLFVDGNQCSSVTIDKITNRNYKVTMFDNAKYVKTKTRMDRYLGKVKYKTGTRISTFDSNVKFLGIKLRKLKSDSMLGKLHAEAHGVKAYFAGNKKGNYINYYEALVLGIEKK